MDSRDLPRLADEATAFAALLNGTERPKVDGLPLYVTLDEITEQRAMGWCDWHPENYCHRCGMRNMQSWFVDRAIWQAIDGDHAASGGIICPQCMAVLYALQSGQPYHVWEIRVHDESGARGRVAELEEEVQRLRRFIHERYAEEIA